MANWDEAQLAEVVERRHGEDNRKKNATQIVSHYIELYETTSRLIELEVRCVLTCSIIFLSFNTCK
jgi:hypothetical protein